MPPYLKRGSLPLKRHITFRQDPGYKGEGLYYEEVVTLAGFGVLQGREGVLYTIDHRPVPQKNLVLPHHRPPHPEGRRGADE